MSAVGKARAAWGAPPAWVSALAAEVDASSLARAGGRIGFSKTAVSLVIGNRYGADTARIAAAVVAVLGAARECPVLGPIDEARCRDARSAPFRPSLPLAGMLRAACRGCPHRADSNDGGGA